MVSDGLQASCVTQPDGGQGTGALGDLRSARQRPLLKSANLRKPDVDMEEDTRAARADLDRRRPTKASQADIRRQRGETWRDSSAQGRRTVAEPSCSGGAARGILFLGVIFFCVLFFVFLTSRDYYRRSFFSVLGVLDCFGYGVSFWFAGGSCFM